MNTQLLASIAIVAALALVGAVVVTTVEISSHQHAFADTQGCHPGKQGFKNSNKACKH